VCDEVGLSIGSGSDSIEQGATSTHQARVQRPEAGQSLRRGDEIAQLDRRALPQLVFDPRLLAQRAVDQALALGRLCGPGRSSPP
jgi:hypothetical protein